MGEQSTAGRPGVDWEALPRLLQELCDGHLDYAVAVYRYDRPGGGHSWLCQACFIRALSDRSQP